jgi:hypothetical protein
MPGMSDSLDRALRQLAAESANVGPAPERELAVLVTFDRRKRRNRWLWTGIAGLAAAAFTALWLMPQREAPVQVPPLKQATAPPEAPFIPIPYVAPLAPYERADIVRVDLPVAALIAAGLPVRTAASGATAQADVIVGQDGRVHAIRVISIAQ